MAARSATMVTVFAHPDDETFSVGGSVAAAVDRGARVTAVCATRGEVGEIAAGVEATRETLGGVREAELRAACAALGVTDVRFLDYRDSGMAGSADNTHPEALAAAPDEEVTGRIAAILREVRPEVVVTFEPEGVYGHPDHKKISRCTAAAFDGVGGQRLYFAGPGRSAFTKLLAEMQEAGVGRDFGLGDLDGFGTPDEDLTTIIDVTPFLERKKRALREHRSQIDPWLASLPDEWLSRLLAEEAFVLARGELTDGARRGLLDGMSG